jgi:hypothetical protein
LIAAWLVEPQALHTLGKQALKINQACDIHLLLPASISLLRDYYLLMSALV